MKEIAEKLGSINGVETVHALCVWSVNVEYVAVTGHLVINGGKISCTVTHSHMLVCSTES